MSIIKIGNESLNQELLLHTHTRHKSAQQLHPTRHNSNLGFCTAAETKECGRRTSGDRGRLLVGEVARSPLVEDVPLVGVAFLALTHHPREIGAEKQTVSACLRDSTNSKESNARDENIRNVKDEVIEYS